MSDIEREAGIQFRPYAYPNSVGWLGWIEADGEREILFVDHRYDLYDVDGQRVGGWHEQEA